MHDLQNAVQLIKSGNREQGKAILEEIIKQNPQNENAWIWLSACVDSDAHKRECLEKVLKIKPNHQLAKNALERLSNIESPALDLIVPNPSNQSMTSAADLILAEIVPDSNLVEIVNLIKSGEKHQASDLLRAMLLEEGSKNEKVWLLLAVCNEKTSWQKDYLQKVLKINPNNSLAYRALDLISLQANTSSGSSELFVDNQTQTIQESKVPQSGQHCPKCGGKLQLTDIYCSKCGFSLRLEKIPPPKAIIREEWEETEIYRNKTWISVIPKIALFIGLFYYFYLANAPVWPPADIQVSSFANALSNGGSWDQFNFYLFPIRHSGVLLFVGVILAILNLFLKDGGKRILGIVLIIYSIPFIVTPIALEQIISPILNYIRGAGNFWDQYSGMKGLVIISGIFFVFGVANLFGPENK